MFYVWHETIQVNTLEEIVLSGNLDLLQYVIVMEQINVLELIEISMNPRMVEFAAYSGSIDLIQYMLDAGAVKCDHLLWWGASSGSVEMVKYLLEKGFDFKSDENVSCDSQINQLKYLHGLTELHGACISGNRATVMHLFEINSGFVNMKNKDGSTPVLLSPYSGSLEVVKYMDTIGDITSVDDKGQNIMHHAALQGQLDIVRYLTNGHPELLFMKDIRGRTPLHVAGLSGSVELVEYLIKKGGNIVDAERNGRTILHTMCEIGNLTLVKHLVENYSVLLKMRDNEGQTPLHIAGFSDSVQLVDFLIRRGADVLDSDIDGRTILHHACSGGKLTIVKHLIENYPALLNKRDILGLTPVHEAGWSDSVELLDYLVSRYSNVFDKDSDGKTILHHACECDKLVLVKHLVENSPALLTMSDNKGQTPLHIAGSSASVKLVDYLISQGCLVLDQDNDGRTVLQNACDSGKLTLVKYLVKKYPALLTMGDNAGWTPIHHAAVSGQIEVVEYLIECGIDPKASSNAGEAALHIARQFQKADLTFYLERNFPHLSVDIKPPTVAKSGQYQMILQKTRLQKKKKRKEKTPKRRNFNHQLAMMKIQ